MAEKKIIDITSAADSKVDIGSKPMIIGHKSMATDPMVREKQIEESRSTENTLKDIQEKTSEAKPEIEPPSAKQKSVEPLADSNTEKQVAVDDKSAEPKSDSEPNKKEDTAQEEKKAEELDPVAVQMEKDGKIKELINSKKYFVSIKQANSGSFKKWVFGLIITILLALIGLFVLIDTGTLDLGFKLPFTIFNTQETLSTQPQSEETEQVQTENQEALEESTINSENSATEEVVENKKTVQNVSILLAEDGDELKLSDKAPASFVNYMKSRLSTFSCNLTENGTGITVNKISEEYASGTVFCDDGYFAYWYLNEGEWLEYSEDVWDCSKVQAIGIPVEFMPTCTDTTNDQEIINPNGSINQ